MKKLIVLVVLLFGCSPMSHNIAGETIGNSNCKKEQLKASYKIYEPDSIIPKFIMKGTSEGVYKIYAPDQIVVPKYIIRREHVYRPGKLVPEKEIKIE